MSTARELGQQHGYKIAADALLQPANTGGKAPQLSRRPSVAPKLDLDNFHVPRGANGGLALEYVLDRPAELGVRRPSPISPQFKHVFMRPPAEATSAGSVNAPPAAQAAVSYLHGNDARAGLMNASTAQGYKPSNQVWPEAGNALFKQRFEGAALPRMEWGGDRKSTGYYPEGDGYINVSPEFLHYRNRKDEAAPAGIVGMGAPALLNHEIEHSRQDTLGVANEMRFPSAKDDPRSARHRTLDRGFRSSGGLEVAPTLGDLVYLVEQHRQGTGKPLDYTVELPDGKALDADWMARMARQHGYFDGRSMQDLLQTPEGLSFTNQVLGGGDYQAPNYGGLRGLMLPLN